MKYLVLTVLFLCVSFLNSGKADDDCNVTDEMRLEFLVIVKGNYEIYFYTER